MEEYMELKILTDEEKDIYSRQIIDLLTESDDDFLPPLSKRGSPKDKSFSQDTKNSDGVISYYTEMNRQPILAAVIDDKIVGFVSFSENYDGGRIPNIYISTLVVSKASRGMGLTTKIYDYLFNTAFADRPFYTRTWSTNIAHTKILSRFGFSEIKRIPNDRGDGIDTVYFEKPAATDGE